MGGEDGMFGSEILRWRLCRLLRFSRLNIIFKLVSPLMAFSKLIIIILFKSMDQDTTSRIKANASVSSYI